MYRNYVELVGYLGGDAQPRYTSNGQAVTNLSLATKHSWQKDGVWQSRTEWHQIVVWNGPAESAAKLTKGAHIRVEGQIRSREYDGQNGKVRTYEIVAFNIEILADEQSRDSSAEPQTAPAPGSDEPSVQTTPAEPPTPEPQRKRAQKSKTEGRP